MQLTLKINDDTLTADLARVARAGTAEVRQKAMEAVGLGLVSMAKRSFNTDPSLRPAPWAPKKDGKPSTLQKSTRLRNSIRVTSASESGVSIGSDAAYAAIHQTGGQTAAHIIRPRFKKALAFGGGVYRMVKHPGSSIPARPYLPFTSSGVPTAEADRMITHTLAKKLGLT